MHLQRQYALASSSNFNQDFVRLVFIVIHIIIIIITEK